MIRTLILSLLSLPLLAQEVLDQVNVAGPDVMVYAWKDSTGQEYLIFSRSSSGSYGDHVAVAVTPRLPPLPVAPTIPGPPSIGKDETYEYAVTLTSWEPRSGWERVEPIGDGILSRYRRRLDWGQGPVEKP